MAHKFAATTADVVLSFQKFSGVDPAGVINAGDAKNLTTKTIIKPQGSGYYGLKIKEGTSCEIEVLGTKYKIQHEPHDVLEAAADNFTITSWKYLGDKTKIKGYQRRLQLLGYYIGKVDGVKGEKSERASLNFQADYGLRSDGVIGAISQQKLDDVMTNNNKFGHSYVIRRPLLRFLRAPTSDPKVTEGRPFAVAPDPDDRGFIKIDTLGKQLYNPAVTIARDTSFRLKVIREHISDSAPLEVRSTNPALLDLLTPTLPNQKEMILQLKANDPGTAPQLAEVKIDFKQGANRIEIASLSVYVLPLIIKNIQPYWVTIADSAGNSPTAPAGTKNDYKTIFEVVNSIWWPYGIYFKTLPWKDKTVNLSTAGRLSNNPNKKAEFDTIIKANDSAGKASKKTVLNLLIVNGIAGCYGITYDAVDYSWPNGIALCKNPKGNISTGIDLAHELGHYLGLADCFSPAKYIHAEDEPDSNHKKNDIWSIRKLMYGGWPVTDRPADGWAHNVGYSHRLKQILLETIIIRMNKIIGHIVVFFFLLYGSMPALADVKKENRNLETECDRNNAMELEELKEKVLEKNWDALDIVDSMADPIEAIPLLADLFKQKNTEVRLITVNCLTLIDDSSAFKILARALTDSIDEIRNTAMQSLRSNYDKSILNELTANLDNDDPSIRESVPLLIGNIGDPKTKDPL
ncbi:MAG: peptidoglycan-binding protein, partial [candidate division Zixibacteria bacterium]|nr:peptidoglycan-binding protein [candidate division Zixibacteria bacterium]